MQVTFGQLAKFLGVGRVSVHRMARALGIPFVQNPDFKRPISRDGVRYAPITMKQATMIMEMHHLKRGRSLAKKEPRG